MPQIRAEPADVLSMVGVASNEANLAKAALYISDASTWVDHHLEGQCTGLTEDRLTIIERHLAAHLMVRGGEGLSGQVVARKRDLVSETYAQRGLSDDKGATPFLLFAAKYDPCGIVARVWLGRKTISARVGEGFADVSGDGVVR